jgi:hypothetical protein
MLPSPGQLRIAGCRLPIVYCLLPIANCSKKIVIFFHNKNLAVKTLDNWAIDVTS